MMRISHIVFAICILLLAGCDKVPTEPQPQPVTGPQMFVTPDHATVAVGGKTIMNLNVKDITQPIFGLSLRLHIGNTAVSYSDSLAAGSDDFFGGDAIRFVQHDDSTIFLSITLTKGQSPVSGTGTSRLLGFEVMGKSVGRDYLYVVLKELYFYDSEGNRIVVPDLELSPAQVQCVAAQ